MNEEINFLLPGDNSMPQMHLSLDFYIVLFDHLQKRKKESKK